MKRTGIKKLELKRLTVKQLTEASGAGMVRRTSNFPGCSDTCTCVSNPCVYELVVGAACEKPGCTNCDIHSSCGGGCGGGCGSGRQLNQMY
jgi:hypothetical protein